MPSTEGELDELELERETTLDLDESDVEWTDPDLSHFTMTDRSHGPGILLTVREEMGRTLSDLFHNRNWSADWAGLKQGPDQTSTINLPTASYRVNARHLVVTLPTGEGEMQRGFQLELDQVQAVCDPKGRRAWVYPQ